MTQCAIKNTEREMRSDGSSKNGNIIKPTKNTIWLTHVNGMRRTLKSIKSTQRNTGKIIQRLSEYVNKDAKRGRECSKRVFQKLIGSKQEMRSRISALIADQPVN